jgi:type VI secretion system ImpJ/VasE family protein
MFLRPQHFQQQERFLETLIERRAMPLRPHAWGITELQINEDLLAVGKFGLRKISAVMPDGTVVNAPADCDLPPPIDVPTDTRSAIVFVSIPPRQPGAAEFNRSAEAAAARFLVSEEEAVDNFAVSRNAEGIETAQPNLKLAVTREQADGRILTSVARISERRDQLVVLDRSYIPSSLTLEAHDDLAGIVEDIGGRAVARAEEMSKRAVAKIEAGTESLTSFLLLQALNRWTPLFAHLKSCPGHHPEHLFAFLLEVAGEMSTFTTDKRRPPDFPAYDHLDLRRCFQPVIDFLVGAFATEFARLAIQLDLESKRAGAYIAPIRDRNIFRTASLFLAVSARTNPAEIAKSFPSQMKIGDVTKMPEIVRAATAGVPIRHVTNLPPQLRTYHELTYFQLDQTVPEWPAIAASAPGIGFAVSGEWPGLKMELWAVKKAGT